MKRSVFSSVLTVQEQMRKVHLSRYVTCLFMKVNIHKHKIICEDINKAKKLTWTIIACTDTNASPVQSHASVELPHVASPIRDPPGLKASPWCPSLAIHPMN